MKLYRKIDIYFAGDYVCSTAQARTCRDARLKYVASIKLRSHSLGGIGLVENRILKHPELLKARFAE